MKLSIFDSGTTGSKTTEDMQPLCVQGRLHNPVYTPQPPCRAPCAASLPYKSAAVGERFLLSHPVKREDAKAGVMEASELGKLLTLKSEWIQTDMGLISLIYKWFLMRKGERERESSK